MRHLILLLLFVVGSAQAQITCADFFEEDAYLGNAIGRFVPRTPGAVSWGSYKCNSCGNLNSARPNFENRQVCRGCGVPHTNETYIKPTTVEKNGRVYILETDYVPSTDKTMKLAKSGPVWKCPFCTSNNFTTEVSCRGCGAQSSGLGEINSLLAVPKATAEAAAHAYSNSLPEEVVRKDVSHLKKKYGIAATSILGVIFAGSVYYFKETHQSPGDIVTVNGPHVTVTYKSGDQKNDKIFELPAGRKPVRVGEKVLVHWNRSSGAFAIERENHDYSVTPIN